MALITTIFCSRNNQSRFESHDWSRAFTQMALTYTWVLIQLFHSLPQKWSVDVALCRYICLEILECFGTRSLVFRIHVLGVCSHYCNSRISNETLAILNIVIFLWESCSMFLRYAPFFPHSDEEGPLENQETLQWSVLEEESNKFQGCETAQRCGSILVSKYKKNPNLVCKKEENVRG